MSAAEVNFDGLVGPTHNFGGLSAGNIKSLENAGRVSNPRAAALQGLAKMRLLMRLGVAQAVLPPHERPHIETLRRFGFCGSDAEVLQRAFKADPTLVVNAASASAMWAANAATASPGADTPDGRLHFDARQSLDPVPPLARSRVHDAASARDLRRYGALLRA